MKSECIASQTGKVYLVKGLDFLTNGYITVMD